MAFQLATTGGLAIVFNGAICRARFQCWKNGTDGHTYMRYKHKEYIIMIRLPFVIHGAAIPMHDRFPCVALLPRHELSVPRRFCGVRPLRERHPRSPGQEVLCAACFRGQTIWATRKYRFSRRFQSKCLLNCSVCH